MYDSHIYYEDFEELKSIVEDIVNGDVVDFCATSRGKADSSRSKLLTLKMGGYL